MIRAGKRRTLHFKKSADEPLDIELDSEMRPMHCRNKCVFCFVDQLPKGMRGSLYVKDDDYRYSFISGSYVTLTNLSDEEVERIVRLHLSPIYISVHAFTDEVRVRLVTNPGASRLIERMRQTVAAVEKLNEEFGGFCWCSDEYYVKAGLAPREYAYYGDFEQIENGVGLFAEFYDNVDYELSSLPEMKLGARVALITGVDFAPFLREKMKEVDAHIGTSSTVFGIVNRFFGETITVAGLVTAGDVIAQADCAGVDAAVIPDNMLKEFGDVFLDNVTLGEVERALGVPVIVVSHNGSDLVGRIAGHFRGEENE